MGDLIDLACERWRRKNIIVTRSGPLSFMDSLRDALNNKLDQEMIAGLGNRSSYRDIPIRRSVPVPSHIMFRMLTDIKKLDDK